jgi:IS1 family transposase
VDGGVTNKTPSSVGHHGVSAEIVALQRMKQTPSEIWGRIKNSRYGAVTTDQYLFYVVHV